MADQLFYALTALLHAVLISGVRLDKQPHSTFIDYTEMTWPEIVAARVLVGAGFDPIYRD